MTEIACIHCDLLLNPKPLQSGEKAVCPRCHQVLYFDDKSLLHSIALLITALIVYLPAVSLPFLSMETAGQTHTMSLISSIATIAQGKTALLAAVVLMLVLLLPLVKLLGLLMITLPLSQGKAPKFTRLSTRYLLQLTPWSMLEVYLIGVLITLVKLTSYADIHFLGGFYAFVLLIILNAVISMRLPRQRLWQAIRAITDPQTHSNNELEKAPVSELTK